MSARFGFADFAGFTRLGAGLHDRQLTESIEWARTIPLKGGHVTTQAVSDVSSLG